MRNIFSLFRVFNLGSYCTKPKVLLTSKEFLLVPDYISNSEEEVLFKEAEKYLRRLRYEFDHWDNAIHGFRETEKQDWSEEARRILDRMKDFSFSDQHKLLPYVHVLDLAADGHIKPHIDSKKFCGDTISGLSLLSDSVMRLAEETDKTNSLDVLLPRRSLYVMRGRARYEYTHEILAGDKAYYEGKLIPRERRISIIQRCEPDKIVDSDSK